MIKTIVRGRVVPTANINIAIMHLCDYWPDIYTSVVSNRNEIAQTDLEIDLHSFFSQDFQRWCSRKAKWDHVFLYHKEYIEI